MDQKTDQRCGRYGGNRDAGQSNVVRKNQKAFRLPPVSRQSPPPRTLQGAQARLSFVPHLQRAVLDHALCRVRRQRPAADDQLQGRNSVSRSRRLSGRKVRRLPCRHRLPHARHRQRDQRQRLDALAADPLLLRHDQQGLSRPHRRKRHLPRLSRATTLGIVTEALRRAGRSSRAL